MIKDLKKKKKKKRKKKGDQLKTFVKNFLCSKPARFYLTRIKKLSDKWQEVIEISDE